MTHTILLPLAPRRRFLKAAAAGAALVPPLALAQRAKPTLYAHRGASALRPEFAARKTRKIIDGEAHEAWFVSDFTFAELKTLRAIVTDAHKAGLQVVVWTFRPESAFLAADFRDGAGANARNDAKSVAEIRRYLETGIDGLFSDDSALARKAIDA